MKFSRLPVFFILFFISGCISISLLFFLWLHQKNIFLSEIETNEKNIIEIGSNVLIYGTENRLDDITFLSDIVSDEYNAATKKFDKETLKSVLLSISKNARVYRKIRLIDTTGQELIRVVREHGKSRIVSENKLQNKSHRHFFKQALSFNHTIYVSPLDLSIENKSIVVPYTPMLRIVSLVHDSQGKSIGLLVLSYLGEAIFRRISSTAQGTFGNVLLINDAGYYLLAPDKKKEWGFMLPGRRSYTFGNDYPRAWKTLEQTDSGSIFTENGLFTYTTLNVASIARQTRELGVDIRAEESWKLVSVVPRSVLRPPWQGQMLAAGVGITGLLLVVSWLWAGAYARRSLAIKDLEKSEKRLKTISDTARDAIILLDGQGKPVHWNPAAERLFGYRFSEVCDSFFHDLICPETLRENVRADWQHFSTTGTGPIVDTVREVTALRRDGTTIPVELGVASIRLDKEWFCVGVARDVTERKEYEASLHYEQEFLRAVLEYIQEGILVSDVQGRVVLSNQVARSLFGIDREENLPQVWAKAWNKRFKILAADGKTPLPPEETPLQRIIRGESIQAMEIVIVPPTGKRRTIIAGGRLLFDLEGREIGAVLSLKDVTDLVAARESARSAERAKSALLSRVGHEFKTPLNGILGLTGLLLEDGLNAQQEDFIREIKHAGNRLLRVLTLLIEYIAIESGERHLHFEAISLEHLLQSIAKRWRGRIEQKGLTLDITSNMHPLPTIHLDAECTNMVLDQLLDNALKFTREGGVSLSVTVEEADSAYSVYISVKDTGIGIAPELRDRLFDEFWQADVSYTRRYQGLGMGLTLAQGLVHLMGGRIWADEAEQGSEFHVLLSPLQCAL